MMKNILLGLGTIATIVTPIAAIVSCGSTDHKTDGDLHPHANSNSSYATIRNQLIKAKVQQKNVFEEVAAAIKKGAPTLVVGGLDDAEFHDNIVRLTFSTGVEDKANDIEGLIEEPDDSTTFKIIRITINLDTKEVIKIETKSGNGNYEDETAKPGYDNPFTTSEIKDALSKAKQNLEPIIKTVENLETVIKKFPEYKEPITTQPDKDGWRPVELEVEKIKASIPEPKAVEAVTSQGPTMSLEELNKQPKMPEQRDQSKLFEGLIGTPLPDQVSAIRSQKGTWTHVDKFSTNPLHVETRQMDDLAVDIYSTKMFKYVFESAGYFDGRLIKDAHANIEKMASEFEKYTVYGLGHLVYAFDRWREYENDIPPICFIIGNGLSSSAGAGRTRVGVASDAGLSNSIGPQYRWSLLHEYGHHETISGEKFFSSKGSEGDLFAKAYEKNPELKVFSKWFNPSQALTDAGKAAHELADKKHLSQIANEDDHAKLNWILYANPDENDPTKRKAVFDTLTHKVFNENYYWDNSAKKLFDIDGAVVYDESNSDALGNYNAAVNPSKHTIGLSETKIKIYRGILTPYGIVDDYEKAWNAAWYNQARVEYLTRFEALFESNIKTESYIRDDGRKGGGNRWSQAGWDSQSLFKEFGISPMTPGLVEQQEIIYAKYIYGFNRKASIDAMNSMPTFFGISVDKEHTIDHVKVTHTKSDGTTESVMAKVTSHPLQYRFNTRVGILDPSNKPEVIVNGLAYMVDPSDPNFDKIDGWRNGETQKRVVDMEGYFNGKKVEYDDILNKHSTQHFEKIMPTIYEAGATAKGLPSLTVPTTKAAGYSSKIEFDKFKPIMDDIKKIFETPLTDAEIQAAIPRTVSSVPNQAKSSFVNLKDTSLDTVKEAFGAYRKWINQGNCPIKSYEDLKTWMHKDSLVPITSFGGGTLSDADVIAKNIIFNKINNDKAMQDAFGSFETYLKTGSYTKEDHIIWNKDHTAIERIIMYLDDSKPIDYDGFGFQDWKKYMEDFASKLTNPKSAFTTWKGYGSHKHYLEIYLSDGTDISDHKTSYKPTLKESMTYALGNIWR